jgi:hypothetical protein
MIIANLMGGLGNQMFQYAFGRMLSISRNVPLKLDLTFLKDRSFKENFTYRDYALDVFNINSEIASQGEINSFKRNKSKKLINLLFLYFPAGSYHLYLREPHFHFFPGAMRGPANTYTDGYWQSERYFMKIRDILFKEFTLKNNFSERVRIIAENIARTNSVSIHVRRGDYQTNAHINKYHGTLEAYYYLKAINLIASKISNPVFYIFSDDPECFV